MDLNQSSNSRMSSNREDQSQELKPPPPAAGSSKKSAKISTKKKSFIFTIIMLLITGIVVFIVFFYVGGKSGSDNHHGDDPQPTPPPPPPPPVKPNYQYNPYKLKASNRTSNYFEGILEFDNTELQDQADIYSLEGQQSLTDDPTFSKFRIASNKIPVGVNNRNIEKVRFKFAQSAIGRCFLTLQDDQNADRWDIPEDIVPMDKEDSTTFLDSMSDFEHDFEKFWWRLGQKYASGSEVLVDTKHQAFVMQDKFIQIDMKLPTQKVYGFGERQREFGLGEGAYTMWANGQETPYDDGTGGKQVYGVHPFCLVKAKTSDRFFGIFFRNSNAQAAIITHNSTDNTTNLSYTTTGGNLQIVFFLQGTAKEIIMQYQNFIGLPTLTPLWSLGWHASAYAYSKLDDIEANIGKYQSNNIPLEGVWLDIKYMNDYVDFSYDKVNFKGLPDLIKKQRKDHRIKFIPIIDAGISADYNNNSSDPNVMALNKYYKMAEESNSLILNSSGQPLLAQVWPKNAAFLDWWAKGAEDVWKQGLQDLGSEIGGYDGIWLDMNEATVFCNGSHPVCFDPNNPGGNMSLEGSFAKPQERRELSQEKELLQFLKNTNSKEQVLQDDSELWYHSYGNMDENSTYYLPFIPMKQNLDNMSLSLNATHDSVGYRQFDTHSLFGHMEAMVTKRIIDRGDIQYLKGKRTFLLSRSTFAGSGKYTQHWLGDNHRSWADMKYSIAGTMNMNMFGIPMIGPDVCGFFATLEYTEDQNKEICGRWMQLATFYPFARQHRDKDPGGGAPNEPYNLGNFSDMAISAIKDRYNYIKFLYTCLYEASQYGKTCYDPLLFHYPQLQGVYEDTEHTFLVGDAIKVSPVLIPWSQMEPYTGPDPPDTPPPYYWSFFPPGRWVNLDNYTQVIVMEDLQGEYVPLSASNKTVMKHLRPGYLLPKQYLESNQMNTDFLSQVGTDIVINRDEHLYAEGTVLYDYGLNSTESDGKHQNYYKFIVTRNSIQKETINTANKPIGNEQIRSFIFLDDSAMNDTIFACIQYMNNSIEQLDINVNKSDNFTQIYLNAGKDYNIDAFSMKNIYFGSFQNATIAAICQVQSSLNVRYAVTNTPNLTNPTAEVKLESVRKEPLKMNITKYEDDIIRITWTYQHDKYNTFKVPEEVGSVHNLQWCSSCTLDQEVIFPEKVDINSPILSIRNPDTNETVFVLQDIAMDFKLLYINGSVYTNPINSQTHIVTGIVGLTTNPNGTYLPDGTYSLYTSPQMTSCHPFFIYKENFDLNNSFTWHGVYSNNQHPQDWVIRNNQWALRDGVRRGQINFTMTATGGVGDLFLFKGRTFGAKTTDVWTQRHVSGPSKVMRDFHKVVGMPSEIPMWALGWHIGQQQFNETSNLKSYVEKYEQQKVGFESLWVGNEIMDEYKVFTLDTGRFGTLPEEVDKLHQLNKKFVPKFGPAIAKIDDGDYNPYNTGLVNNLFTYSNLNDDYPLIGIDRRQVVYPNFFNIVTKDWWGNQLSNFYQFMKFDGVMIAQNNPHSKCDGACFTEQKSSSPIKNQLLFTPEGADLEKQRLPLDAFFQEGISYLDAYNIYGTMVASATKLFFNGQNKKSFIGFEYGSAGIGKYAHKWIGVDKFSYKAMGQSVINIMMYNMMGIPLSGSQICGQQSLDEVRDQKADEICLRWYYLGAMSPFSRLFNSKGSYENDPFNFSIDTGYQMQQAINMKYHLVPYYYTELKLISRFGGAFFQPLFFEFSAEPQADEDLENNVMLGPALKASFLSNQQVPDASKQYRFYFPGNRNSLVELPTTWCSMISIQNTSRCFTGGQFISLQQDTTDSFDLAIRGGFIVPMLSLDDLHQPSDENYISTTFDVQNRPISLYVNPKCNITDDGTRNTTHSCEARGEYWIDGTDEVVSSNWTHANFSFEYMDSSYYLRWDHDWKNSSHKGEGTGMASDNIGQVVIYNIAMNQMAGNNTWTLHVCEGESGEHKCHEHSDAGQLLVDRDELKFENREEEVGYKLNLHKYKYMKFTPVKI